MDAEPITAHRSARKTLLRGLAVAAGAAVVLGLLHWHYAGVKVGGVYWFNLDKERNLPTWFSGILFLLFGCTALIAGYWEQRRNQEGAETSFRMPVLWIGVGLVGLLMSLDEMTILHENLFWREIRQASSKLGNEWKYVTQWQVLFAPLIVALFGYFVVFFSNRYNTSAGARRCAFAGIACWLGALSLEGVRGAFKLTGKSWYSLEVLLEEELEMFGALFLLASIAFYALDIALDFGPDRRKRLGLGSRFLTRRAATAAATVVLVLSAVGGGIYLCARRQAESGAAAPRLFRKLGLGGEHACVAGGRHVTSSRSSVAPARTGTVWLDELRGVAALSDSDTSRVARLAADAVLRSQKLATDQLPARLQQDVLPRIVFLSVSDGSSSARVAIGAGHGIVSATERALTQSLAHWRDGSPPKWVKIDLVAHVETVESLPLTAPVSIERSLAGFAFERGSDIALLPEEAVANTLINSRGLMQPANIARHVRGRPGPAKWFERTRNSATATVHYFTTQSFFCDGTSLTRLLRGHRLFGQISADGLLSAARRGGEYLAQAVEPDGQFIYAYRPKTDEALDKYNILRHSGTIYAMLELYEVTRDPQLLSAAELAIQYLLRSIKPADDGNACVVEGGYVKLGGNALAALALAKYTEVTGDMQYLSEARALGRWVQSVQKANGDFVHKQAYPQGEVADFVSQYYPGEALLALVRLYALDSDERWLDTAERGARYLINVRDRGKTISQLTHDHWLLYALRELYGHRPDPQYFTHAMSIAQAIIRSQNRNPSYRDWLGSYYRPPRSTPTATRSEGLCAAYHLAQAAGHVGQAQEILQAIRLGVAFQLQTQFRPETAMYLSHPQRVLGGFRRSLTNFEIRIDYVQHNISSLLELRRILGERATGPSARPKS